MRQIIISYIVGLIISVLQEVFKTAQKARLKEPTATKVRLIGGVLSTVASFLIHWAGGTLTLASFDTLSTPLRDALLYFLGSVAAYYSAIKDSPLNFSKR